MLSALPYAIMVIKLLMLTLFDSMKVNESLQILAEKGAKILGNMLIYNIKINYLFSYCLDFLIEIQNIAWLTTVLKCDICKIF